MAAKGYWEMLRNRAKIYIGEASMNIYIKAYLTKDYGWILYRYDTESYSLDPQGAIPMG